MGMTPGGDSKLVLDAAQVEREIEGIENLRIDWEVPHGAGMNWDSYHILSSCFS